MHNFKQFKIWKRSLDLAAELYKTTETFPKSEVFGITNQIRKCAVSIPSNIAEGAGRGSNNDFIRFLYYSYGSSCELETQLLLSNKLGYLETPVVAGFTKTIDELQKMIFKLIEKYQGKVTQVKV